MSESPDEPERKDPDDDAPPDRRLEDWHRVINALLLAAILAAVLVIAGLVVPTTGASRISAPAPTPMDYVPYSPQSGQ